MQRHADEHQASGPTRHMKYAAALRLKNADVFLLLSVILMNRSAASHAQRKAAILLVKFYSFLRHLYLRPHVHQELSCTRGSILPSPRPQGSVVRLCQTVLQCLSFPPSPPPSPPLLRAVYTFNSLSIWCGSQRGGVTRGRRDEPFDLRWKAASLSPHHRLVSFRLCCTQAECN